MVANKYLFFIFGKNTKEGKPYTKVRTCIQSPACRHKNLTHLNQQKHFKAFGYHTKAIELNPNLATAYYNRGIVLKSLGKTEAAIADFTKARDLKINKAY